jgi:hypothetical protein
MRESKFFQEIEDEVRLNQARVFAQDALDARFGPAVAAEFAELVNGIQDVDKLRELSRLAIKSRGLAAFRRALASRT